MTDAVDMGIFSSPDPKLQRTHNRTVTLRFSQKRKEISKRILERAKKNIHITRTTAVEPLRLSLTYVRNQRIVRATIATKTSFTSAKTILRWLKLIWFQKKKMTKIWIKTVIWLNFKENQVYRKTDWPIYRDEEDKSICYSQLLLFSSRLCCRK